MFKQDPAYDEKSIIEGGKMKLAYCMFGFCLLFCFTFNQSFAEFMNLAPVSPGCFLLEYTFLL